MNETISIGSLCSGYGGLEMGLTDALTHTHTPQMAWHAETDPHAARVLAKHWPDVPNHGDLTTYDWTQAQPVDIITAGWPCQPWSLAGKRRGAADERAIWPAVAHAIRTVRPRHVFLENVPAIIALGELTRAVADLATLGYVGSWRCIRASDVGAPHRRERTFIAARLADAQGCESSARRARLPAAAVGGDPRAVTALLPTPHANASTGAGTSGRDGGLNLQTAVTLLPSPRARDYKGIPGAGFNSGNLPAAVDMLPTPRASDGDKGGPNQADSRGKPALSAVVQPGRWGAHGDAIGCWEQVTGRSAPDPTELGRGGEGARLASRFVEWMMGLPDGWVTDHVRRNAALQLLGNGVVPLQAELAWYLLSGS